MLFTDSDRLVDKMPLASVFPFFPPTRKGALSWISDLDNLSLSQKRDALLEVTDGLNQYQCTSQNRYELLNLLLDPSLEVIRQSSKSYNRQNATPSTKASLAFEAVHQLISTLITGFNLIATEDVSNFYSSENLRTLALHQAAALCHLKLTEALVMYSSEEQPWEIFHRIVRFSRRLHENETPIVSGHKRLVGHDRSIEDIYKASLILSLCHPFQLTQPQIKQLAKFSLLLAYHLEECDPNDIDCAFVVRPYDHSSPTPANLIPSLERAGYWGFTAKEFLTLVETNSRSLPKLWKNIDTKVRRMVFKALANPPFRKEVRESCHISVDFLIGLGRLQRYLIKLNDLNASQGFLPVAYMNHGVLIDQSSTGAQLQWNVTVHQPPRIQVGNLIAWRQAETLRIGIIRWLKKSSAQIIRMGLETLGEMPVNISFPNSSDQNKQDVAGILACTPTASRYKLVLAADAPSPIEFMHNVHPTLFGIESLYFDKLQEKNTSIRVYDVSYQTL